MSADPRQMGLFESEPEAAPPPPRPVVASKRVPAPSNGRDANARPAQPASSHAQPAAAHAPPAPAFDVPPAIARLRRRAAMLTQPRVRVSVLGSGSGGNATVVQCGDRAMLVDAGFGPATIAKRLKQAGVATADVRAICLTHLDQDHFRPQWVRTICRVGIRVYLHRWHVAGLHKLPFADELFERDLLHEFDGDAFEPLPGLRATSVPLPHDDKGTSAFHLEAGDVRIGYATDLGHVPAELIDRFAGVDVLLIESNYDPHMQRTSSRPWFLKQRVMGSHGHLSNEQAYEAACRIADRSPAGNPQRIVLLHRSAQCNTAQLVKEAFEQDGRFADRVTLTQQRRRTPWIDVRPLTTEQMGLRF